VFRFGSPSEPFSNIGLFLPFQSLSKELHVKPDIFCRGGRNRMRILVTGQSARGNHSSTRRGRKSARSHLRTAFFSGAFLPNQNQMEIDMQNIETQLLDVINTVSAWDIPDDDFADAVNAQMKLMAGVPADELWCFDSETPIH
jgi:hypothetical protein